MNNRDGSLNEMINGNFMDTYGDPPMALYGGLDGLGDYKIIFQLLTGPRFHTHF